MEKRYILLISLVIIIILGLIWFFYIPTTIKDSDCKVYASPCCADGYVCALSEPTCNLIGDYQCKESNPPALTRVYCVYNKPKNPFIKKFGEGCFDRPLYNGANCEEYCSYWKSQNCTSTFTETELIQGWDPFDLEKWKQNCEDKECECIKSSHCAKEGETAYGAIGDIYSKAWCCPGLDQIWDKNERLFYCVNCGDGKCGKHENKQDCPKDCDEKFYDKNSCAKEDELIYPQDYNDQQKMVVTAKGECCSGLKPVGRYNKWTENQCIPDTYPAYAKLLYCEKCGDGICKQNRYENSCNCPEDCKEAGCHKEGEIFSRAPMSDGGQDLRPCCSGLTDITGIDISVCINCGDSICKDYGSGFKEDIACPQDCS